jgi:DNA polymerase I-like protein with 3'-5' exonuclease and polymerase domains
MYRLLQLAVAGQVPFKYNLQFLTAKFLGVTIEKDERRENFAQFIGQPIESIPQDYLEYGAIDVIATRELFLKLSEYIQRHDRMGTMLSHNIQIKGDLALKRIYKSGIGFDIPMRDEWLQSKNMEIELLGMQLSDWGLIRGVKGYKEQYRYVVEDLLQLPVPYRYKKLLCHKFEDTWYYSESGMIDINNRKVRVEEGQSCHGEPSISSQREDLEEYYDGYPFIKSFLDFMELEKAMSFVKDLEGERQHPRYNLLVNTGRTSCSSPNFQQLPKMGGIREMFKAEEGKTFIITDYSAVELATLSQVLYSTYGESVMRDKINEGIDLHKYYGTTYYGKPIEKITKQERQTCKAPNFGFPGGLGAKTFIQFSRGYGLQLTEGEARSMKEAWFDTFPETREYMKDEKGMVYTLTGRKRGNTSYCAEKNTPFQGLAADGAKLALYNLVRSGFKVVGFVHDEIITEVNSEEANTMLLDQERIMIESMQEVVPDVKIGVESAISDFYTK